MDEKEESLLGAGVEDIEMDDATLFYHYYRLYMVGQNSAAFPWIMPKDIPEHALSESNLKLMEQFIQQNSHKISWTKPQTWFLCILKVLYPPLA